MVRFAICDDDAAYMKQIVKIIKDTYESMSDFNEPCECILYNSGEELIKNFIEDKIDIFFLDIECGQDLGFDIAKELQKQKKDLGIVYITNHENYMASAFVCRPLGFICKKAAKEGIKMPMLNILEYLNERRQRLSFTDKNSEFSLLVSDIIVVEIFGRDLLITLIDKQIECLGPLQKYEEGLIKYGFIQIARGIFVNKKYISKIKGNEIYLAGKIRYNISRRRMLEVEKIWKG
ncbi:MAG: response regulator transcription factor [Lachnospiraceae bacterium]|nr:response regulator transcription factor [Lachnospiraceae bacterium]